MNFVGKMVKEKMSGKFCVIKCMFSVLKATEGHRTFLGWLQFLGVKGSRIAKFLILKRSNNCFWAWWLPSGWYQP